MVHRTIYPAVTGLDDRVRILGFRKKGGSFMDGIVIIWIDDSKDALIS